MDGGHVDIERCNCAAIPLNDHQIFVWMSVTPRPSRFFFRVFSRVRNLPLHIARFKSSDSLGESLIRIDRGFGRTAILNSKGGLVIAALFAHFESEFE